MPSTTLFNGIITDLSMDRSASLITVNYPNQCDAEASEQTVKLLITPQTVILDFNGTLLSAASLTVGTLINASFSSALTRSIPPQATAYLIQILESRSREPVTIGRITDIDRETNSFTTISDRNPSTMIRFNTSENTQFINRMGRPSNFARLTPGMRVRVRHAEFMTASIPPQTTALEVQIL